MPLHADGQAIAADAPYSKELQRLVSQAFAERKVVAAVGYGVSALLNAKILDAKHPQAGMSILFGKQVRDHWLAACALQPQCLLACMGASEGHQQQLSKLLVHACATEGSLLMPLRDVPAWMQDFLHRSDISVAALMDSET